MPSLTIDALLELWLADLRANDLAPGTVLRYKSAVESFFGWYEQEEQRSLTLEQLSPVILIGYRNFLQRTQKRATSTVNGHISALRAWCAWMTVERYLETNPAKRIKLVGRQEASSREGLEPTQVNALLRQVQPIDEVLRGRHAVEVAVHEPDPVREHAVAEDQRQVGVGELVRLIQQPRVQDVAVAVALDPDAERAAQERLVGRRPLSAAGRFGCRETSPRSGWTAAGRHRRARPARRDDRAP